MNDSETRDAKGCFAKGVSGNPGGRPRGSKNRPRQQAPASAATWIASEWKLFHKQAVLGAHGNPVDAAFETAALFIATHPPKTAAPGRCPECGQPISLIAFSVRSYPMAALGAWVHSPCAPYFAQRRFAEAAQALKKMGIDWPI